MNLLTANSVYSKTRFKYKEGYLRGLLFAPSFNKATINISVDSFIAQWFISLGQTARSYSLAKCLADRLITTSIFTQDRYNAQLTNLS